MHRNKPVLALIPARGGSKGIPLKNLAKVGGRSLVERAIGVARATPIIDRILVSSDSKRIIRHVNRLGEFAPFVRPAELAQDSTPSLPVFAHALDWAEKCDDCIYEFIVVLEPPCPFRTAEQIETAVKLAHESNASSVVSLVKVSDCHPVRIKRILAGGRLMPFCVPEPEGLRRQDQEDAFIRNSGVYVFARETIISGHLWGNTPHGIVVDRALYGVNIDEPIDLTTARSMYSQMRRQGKLHLIEPQTEI